MRSPGKFDFLSYKVLGLFEGKVGKIIYLQAQVVEIIFNNLTIMV